MAGNAAAATPPAQTPDGLISRLGGKVRKWKDAANQAAKERDDAKKLVEDLQKQVKDLTGRADGNEAAKQRDELAQQLRTLKHQGKFNELAKAAGATTETQLKDLWQLSGYQAEGEEPDPKAIQSLIDGQKKERSYLFGKSEQQAGDEASPGAGRGKGYSDKDNQGHFIVTRAQANDPLWMRENAGKIAKASAEKRFILEDPMLVR